MIILLLAAALAPAPIVKTGLTEYITGGWVVGPSCQTDTGEIFTRDGQYLTLEEEGRWKSNGSEIVITVSGRTARYRVKPISRDRAFFQDHLGNEWFARRCKGE